MITGMIDGHFSSELAMHLGVRRWRRHALRNSSAIRAGLVFREGRSTILLSRQIRNYRIRIESSIFPLSFPTPSPLLKVDLPAVSAIISTLHVYDNVPQHTHAVFEWCFYRAQSIAR